MPAALAIGVDDHVLKILVTAPGMHDGWWEWCEWTLER